MTYDGNAENLNTGTIEEGEKINEETSSVKENEQFVVDALAVETSIEKKIARTYLVEKETIEDAVKIKTTNAPTVPPIPVISQILDSSF